MLESVDIRRVAARWTTRAVACDCLFIACFGAEAIAGADRDRGRFVAGAVNSTLVRGARRQSQVVSSVGGETSRTPGGFEPTSSQQRSGNASALLVLPVCQLPVFSLMTGSFVEENGVMSLVWRACGLKKAHAG